MRNSCVYQCAINLSKADPDLLERIEKALSHQGVYCADKGCDIDHHRSVVTLVGSELEVLLGLKLLVEQVREGFELSCHQGVHPRIGLVDVVPIVPLFDTPLEAGISLAHHCAQLLWDEFAIPSLYYDHAFKGSRSLPLLRREHREGRLSFDHGATLHPSYGATAVGCRKPLVAYNVVLESQDLELARRIAKTIRVSDGGHQGIRALGLPLESQKRVQVSMNLFDLEAIDLLGAFELVHELAEKEGVEVGESELIGLTPIKALISSALKALKMKTMENKQVLENSLLEYYRMKEQQDVLSTP